MALQVFSRGLLVPWWGTQSSGTPGLGSITTDANDEVAAYIIRAPKAGDIRGVHFMANVVTGADRTIGIYTVDAATGSPTTPPTAHTTNAFVVKALTTGDNDDWVYSGNFTANATVAKGDLIAVCFIAPSSSPGDIRIYHWGDAFVTSFPYNSTFASAAWTKSQGPANLLLEYSDGSVALPLGCSAIGDAAGVAQPVTTSFNSGTTPDVRGARFRFPGPVRANGAWVWADGDGNYSVKLVTADWDGGSTGLLATGVHDSDVRVNTSVGIHLVEFDAAVELDSDTYYRLVIEPTSGSGVSIYHYDCANDAQLGAQPLGANFHMTTAKDPNDNGDWTNYDNGTSGRKVPFMGLVLDAIDDAIDPGVPSAAQIAEAVAQRTIADGYSADGAQPTIQQAILEIRQMLMEAEISGDTVLIKKPDGTTTAMTITVSPDMATATSRTRSG